MTYTDNMLSSLQTIISNTVNESRQTYETFYQQLQNTYEVCSQNRSDLAGGIGEQDTYYEQDAAEGTANN